MERAKSFGNSRILQPYVRMPRSLDGDEWPTELVREAPTFGRRVSLSSRIPSGLSERSGDPVSKGPPVGSNAREHAQSYITIDPSACGEMHLPLQYGTYSQSPPSANCEKTMPDIAPYHFMNQRGEPHGACGPNGMTQRDP
jgi:hypothetical protein